MMPRISVALVLLMSFSPGAYAADSYRWLHVTIETPWAIFIFLLPMVLLPAVLMAFLYWRVAIKRTKEMKDKIDTNSNARSDTV